ncbi:MAG: hypothetical protein G01um101429_1044 [Parcubacteria group bacterium Gr01-1014_29]|nr:MAG: hypothetical protein G01um101429_1044 [Parcubacteria group bacterium Gr01-1014_29]
MKCQFQKLNSEQCEANAMEGVDYCFTHNPETQAEKEQAVLSGGFAPKPRKEAKPLDPVSVRSTKDILALLEDTINRVRTEPMTHQKANCVGYLANIAIKALEVDELDEKLEFVKSFILERKNKR